MDSTVNESSLRYPGWRVVFAASGCVFCGLASLLVYTIGVFLKPLAAEFGWSREAVAAAFSSGALAVAVCSPGLGFLLDRFPARRIILPCFAVFGCAWASLAFLTHHLWHLYAVFIVLGIVGNGTAHLAFVRVISTWFYLRRGVAFAVLLTGGALGAMILPSVAQALISAHGWRFAFAALGAMVLLVGLPLGTMVRPRASSARDVRIAVTGSSVGQGLRSRAFWIIVTVLFCVSISQNGVIAHMSALLTDRGIAAAKAALAVSAMGLGSIVGRLFTGLLLDRWQAPRVAFGLILLAAAGTWLLSGTTSESGGVASALLIGIGMGGEADVTPFLLSRYFGLRSFSVFYGLTWTFFAIAGAIGPVIMGKAFDVTGSYSVLLSRLAILTLMAGSLMLLLPSCSSTAWEAVTPETSSEADVVA